MSKIFPNGLTNRQMGGKIKQLQKPNIIVTQMSTRRSQISLIFLIFISETASRRLRMLMPHIPP